MEFTHKIPSVEAYNQLRVNAGMIALNLILK